MVCCRTFYNNILYAKIGSKVYGARRNEASQKTRQCKGGLKRMEQLEFDLGGECHKIEYEHKAKESLKVYGLSTCEKYAEKIIEIEGDNNVYARLAKYADESELNLERIANELESGFGGHGGITGGEPNRTNRAFAEEFCKVIGRKEREKQEIREFEEEVVRQYRLDQENGIKY